MEIFRKDNVPVNTINNVRDFLGKIGVLTQEFWSNVGNSIYSVHVIVINTTITANGKGSTKEYALASAYGELSERLSFFLPFRVSPFYRYFYTNFEEIESLVSEKISINKWLNTLDAEKYFSNFSLDNNSFINEWKVKFTDKDEDSFTCKFHHLDSIDTLNHLNNTTDTILLPYKILDYHYGSNGMCAGNSKEEALIQGISEIVERYTQREILLNPSHKCYDITDYCLNTFDNIKDIIDILKEHNITMKILECYNDIKIPVIAVILIKNLTKYYVSFGCHPDLNIAVERTVTELFQGYDLNSIESAFENEYIISENKLNTLQNNYISLLKYGIGKYNLEFILGLHEKHIPHYNEFPPNSNHEILSNILYKFNYYGKKIYIVEGLGLGLNTFHVIIPGYSEAKLVLSSKKINSSIHNLLYGDLDNLTTQNALNLANHCSLLHSSGSKLLTQLIDIDKYVVYENCNTNINGIYSSLFIAMLYIKGDNLFLAKKYIEIFLNEISTTDYETYDEIIYYKLLLLILDMKNNGYSNKIILDYFGDEHDDIIAEIISLIDTKQRLFNEIPPLNYIALLNENTQVKKVVSAEITLLKNLFKFYTSKNKES